MCIDPQEFRLANDAIRSMSVINMVDVHTRATASANAVTRDTFGKVGPYTPGTPEHEHWLTAYDMAFNRIVLKGE